MIADDLFPQVAARFKALSDQGRLRLLAALQRGEKSVAELARAVERSQPNVSQHLASLLRYEIVAVRREGNRAFYRIADATVLRICDVVCASLAGGAPAKRTPGSRSRRRRTGSGR